jgi:hypothetical protein
MARTMLDEHRTPMRFWAEAVNTACHVSNRILLRTFKKKTCYELMHGRAPKVMRRWPRTSLKRRRMKLEMMMERTMRLKLNVYPLLSLQPLQSVDRLLHGQRRCDKRTRREKLKLRGR